MEPNGCSHTEDKCAGYSGLGTVCTSYAGTERGNGLIIVVHRGQWTGKIGTNWLNELRTLGERGTCFQYRVTQWLLLQIGRAHV